MTDTRLEMTRRVALGMTFVVPASLWLAPTAAAINAQPVPEQLASQLAKATLPFAPAQLELLRCDTSPCAQGAHMSAVVRLDWPPGYRIRHFSRRGQDLAETVAAFADDIIQQFSRLG